MYDHDIESIDPEGAKRRRDNGWGYEEPDWERAQVHVHRMMDLLLDTLQHTFGVSGVRALKDANPKFFQRVDAVVREAYLSGHFEGAGDAAIEAGHKAHLRTHRVVLAALESSSRGKESMAVEMLQAMAEPEEGE